LAPVKGEGNRRRLLALVISNQKKGANMPTYDPHKSTTEVRQGNRRLMNMRVLVFSLIGIVLLFGILYLVFALNAPPTVQ